ncbi:hypothetical protein [Cytobacillus sp. IB215316]|uniref:hypothetical protein n=1 Tax=Cytobacillus sp. IB215316 TaxID=3097354 RepID=UPI002A1219DA|nr:hypothetical protein [Cytobacillus sp. IB215316]MDX8363509.1 hypothetical protein [Cytobacillus sp. IB215316]
MLFKETIIQLIMIISFGVGAILMVLFPILKKENQYYAWFSMVSGITVWLLLLNIIAQMRS